MASQRRQHYVPKFLLRRFAAQAGKWRGHIFRLDKRSGRARLAVPRTEGAKNRYYELPDDVAGEFQPEAVLQRIESDAAIVISKLERQQQILADEVVRLAYFCALQTVRTPVDRAERRYLDEVMAVQLEQLRFSANERAADFLRQNDPSLSTAEAEARRRQIVNDLESGRIRLESTAEREVAGMFLGLEAAVGQLAAGADWTLVVFADAPALVLCDAGYTRFDPSPRVPGSGSGFLGSETVETVITLSPSTALVITSGTGAVGFGFGEAAYARELNLRAYAQSAECIYGTTQQDVVEVHRAAKANPSAAISRQRRARTLWIGERRDGDRETGPYLFRGYSIDGDREEWFDVDPRARRGKGVTPEDMWR